MKNENVSPDEELKPWYYQYWFLYPTFILWPLWSILILRSPWHNGVLSGAIAWAWLISGGYLIIKRAELGGTVLGSTLAFVVPGILFTILTQILWLKDKNKLREEGVEVDSPTLLTAAIRKRNPRRKPQGRRRRR